MAQRERFAQKKKPKDTRGTLKRIIRYLSEYLWVVILLVVSIFMMSNTIKLATFTRREEIAVMKMVGASNGFIRFPFVVEGLILGLLGAGVGFLLEWGIYNFISNRIMESFGGNLFRAMSFSVIMTPLLAVYLALGVLVGAFGGVNAIRNYLKV